jgi:hypothetical protein
MYGPLIPLTTITVTKAIDDTGIRLQHPSQLLLQKNLQRLQVGEWGSGETVR